MATAELTAKDRERFERARARGRDHTHDASSVVDARYEPATDAIHLVFRGGGSMMIPRRVIPGLERQSRPTLESVSISAAGDALSWPSLDIDVFVPGLVERVFGTRLFAAATGRRGGRRRTKAKVVAAKLNGVKGGRPRKRASG
jgi:hypothetical protein